MIIFLFGTFCSYWNYTWFFVPVLGPHIGAIVGALMYQIFVGAHWPEEKCPVDSGTYKPTIDMDMEEMRTPLNSPVVEYMSRSNGKSDGNRSYIPRQDGRTWLRDWPGPTDFLSRLFFFIPVFPPCWFYPVFYTFLVLKTLFTCLPIFGQRLLATGICFILWPLF